MTKNTVKQLKSHTFILLEQGKISLLDLNQDQNLDTLHSQEWEAKTLSQALEKLSKHLDSDSVSIVLGDNLSFITPVFIDKSTKDIKQAILDKAELKISVDLDELGVDWIQVAETDDSYVYQVFAVQKSLLSLLGRAAEQASLAINSVEPLAFLLGYVYSLDQPNLVYWESTRSTIALIKANKVLTVAITKPQKVYSSIKTLLSFAKDKLSITPTTIVMASASGLNSNKLKSMSLQVFSSTKNPLEDKKSNNKLFPAQEEETNELDLNLNIEEEKPDKEFELDTDLKKDEQIDGKVSKEEKNNSEELDISPKAPKLPLRVAKEINMDEAPTPKPVKAKPKIQVIIVALTVVAILIGIVVGGILVYQNALKSANEPIEPASDEVVDDSLIQTNTSTSSSQAASPSAQDSTSSDQDQPDSTDTDSSMLDASIQVLNGSGVAGEAGRASSLLEDVDFSDIDTGNADSFDYAATEISVKAGQGQLLQSIQAALEDEYSIGQTDQELDPDSDYDAVIIVGQE